MTEAHFGLSFNLVKTSMELTFTVFLVPGYQEAKDLQPFPDLSKINEMFSLFLS